MAGPGGAKEVGKRGRLWSPWTSLSGTTPIRINIQNLDVGFHWFISDRSREISHSLLCNFNIITDNEALAINLELSNNQNLTLATIYCPNGKPNLSLFQTICNLSDNVMFVGDFISKSEAFGCASKNASGPILKTIQNTLDLIYLNNTEHTYMDWRNGNTDILDMVFITQNLIIHDTQFQIGVNLGSNHLPIEITIDTTPHRNTFTNPTRYKFDQTDREVFESILEEALGSGDFSGHLSTNDLDRYADFIVTALHTAVDKAIPKSKSVRPESNPISNETLALIKEKRKLRRQYSQMKDSAVKTHINQLQKQVKDDLRVESDRVRNGFEKGSLTGMILIDLQKAFDTIDHKILTEKMNCLGFAESTIRWYKSYLTNRCFIVNVGNDFSSPGKLLCGVPQGSILGPLLFLLYVNDMPQAVNSDLLLYADDTCLIYTGKDINTIEEQLNTDFSSLCDWFVDNKLSVHFGEEKTKSILFGTKRQLKNQRDLDLRYGDIEIKQHSKVTYLGCILDNDLSGESMATKVLRLVNNRLNFFYRKLKNF